MPDTPGTVNFPASLDSNVSLIQAKNNASTTLTTGATSSDTTLTVASTSTFPASGALTVEGEVIFYTGTTATTLTGCLRGQDGTTAAAHSSGAVMQGLIVAAHHNTLASALIATETKLGSGSSTPSNNAVLKGTGSGTSAWGTLTASNVGALAIANNLSDVNSAATSRTNLGLGTAATLNVAASGNAASGEVVKGNDTRLTDSRTPTGTAGGSLSGTYPNPTLAANSATDTAIGNRTINQTTSMGGTPDTGPLTTLLGRLGNIIKAITGKTNWSDTPDITLASLNAHKNRHVTGGADAFASTDVIEAIVKRVRETSGPTTLSIGSVTDGQYLKRSGTSIIGTDFGGGAAYILIWEQKTQGTDGGTFTSGAWRTRDLNTEVIDTGNYASVSSSQVTLAAGTYDVIALAPARKVDSHKLRLYNVTDSTQIILGSNARSDAASGSDGRAMLLTRFTTTASKVIELQHRCTTTKNTDGFGIAGNFSDEIYAVLQLWKVA